MFISWLYVVLYQVKLSHDLKDSKQLVLGAIGSIFFIWVIWASGIDYFLMCLIAYLIGIVFYIQARKQKGVEKLFTQTELILLVLLVVGAIFAIYRLATGQIQL